MYTVYKHTCPNNKVYIGITCHTVSERWRSGRGYRTQFFYRAIKKYGWHNIKHEILFENLTKEEAEAKEIELISVYRSNDKKYGYNIENGGQAIGTHSEATKRKISLKHKGRIFSEEAKAKMRLNHADFRGEKHPMYGKKFSAEVRRHMSEGKIGKFIGEKNGMFGRKHSDEIKKLQSINRKGKCVGADNHKALAVSQYTKNGEFVNQYACILDAARELKIARGGDCHISACAKGRLKSAYGYVWKYVDSGVAV